MGRGVEFAGTERFQIKRRLGAGGMGVVYEAFDHERQERVALKTLLRFDAQALFRFKNEFRALHDINHPNLISLYELSEEDGECFFTMELIRGVDFLSYVRWQASGLEPEGPVTPSAVTEQRSARSSAITGLAPLPGSSVQPCDDTLQAEKIAAQMSAPEPCTYDESRLRAALKQLAQGVAALHAAGNVHRDVKPSNILVTGEGRVVLLDFGLVTATSKEGQSTQASVVGTAEYMAPEQAVSGDVGPAADWYSVGVVLYEALTARLPHTGRSPIDLLMAKQEHVPPPPRARVPDVPQDLDELCVALLDTDPRKRPSVHRILDWVGAELDVELIGLRASTVTGFTQTTPFLGREKELAQLRVAFDDSQKKPVVVLVEGASGLGKSELVRQFSLILSEEVPDAVILSGRCYERESVAYKAFDGIVDELSRHLSRLPKVEATALMPVQAGLLPRLFPVLQRVEQIAAAPREEEIPEPQEQRRRMFGALRELFLRLSKRHPVVLVIDDLQWTDTDSLILLQELLGDAASPNLLLVATLRPVGLEERARILGSVQILDQRQIDVAAFSSERSKELAALLLPSLDDGALGVIAREAAGHPLFVMELARYAQDQGHSKSQSQGEKITLDKTLWQRISQLPANLLTLLELLCVADAPLTQETAATAAEMAQAEMSKATSGLRISYLVRTGGVRATDLIEPYHDRIRQIVSRHLSDNVRKHCHYRLALALEQTGAAQSSPHALVRHAEAAGDSERASRYAEAAAQHAIAAMAFDQAAEFFQTALRLGEHGEDKTRRLRLALAEAFVNAGRGPEAAEVFLTAAEGADANTRLDCQRQASEQWLKSGHTERGLAATRELLAYIGVKMPVTPQRALISLLWSRAKLRIGGLRWEDTDEGEIRRTVLTRLDIYKAVSHGLSLVDTIRGMDFQARGLLLALATGERTRVARALFLESAFRSSQGGPKAAAHAQLLVARASRIDSTDLYLRAWKSTAEGIMCYFGSHLRSAAEHFAVAEPLFREQAGATWELGSVRLFHLWSLLRMGAPGEMVPLVDEYARDATRRGDLYATTTILRSCHLVWLAKGDMAEAQRVLDESSWAPPEGRYHLQHWYEFRAIHEMGLYEEGATDLWETSQRDFAALKKSLLLRIVTVRLDAHWLRGRLALASAMRSPQSAKLLREAQRMAKLLEREKDIFASASAPLLRAAISAQKGELEDAVSMLSTAVEAAESADLILHAASARRRLGQLKGGDEGAALIALADTSMAAEGIGDPTQMTEVYAPGFPR